MEAFGALIQSLEPDVQMLMGIHSFRERTTLGIHTNCYKDGMHGRGGAESRHAFLLRSLVNDHFEVRFCLKGNVGFEAKLGIPLRWSPAKAKGSY
jgi:hypothetical protein